MPSINQDNDNTGGQSAAPVEQSTMPQQQMQYQQQPMMMQPQQQQQQQYYSQGNYQQQQPMMQQQGQYNPQMMQQQQQPMMQQQQPNMYGSQQNYQQQPMMQQQYNSQPQQQMMMNNQQQMMQPQQQQQQQPMMQQQYNSQQQQPMMMNNQQMMQQQQPMMQQQQQQQPMMQQQQQQNQMGLAVNTSFDQLSPQAQAQFPMSPSFALPPTTLQYDPNQQVNLNSPTNTIPQTPQTPTSANSTTTDNNNSTSGEFKVIDFRDQLVAILESDIQYPPDSQSTNTGGSKEVIRIGIEKIKAKPLNYLKLLEKHQKDVRRGLLKKYAIKAAKKGAVEGLKFVPTVGAQLSEGASKLSDIHDEIAEENEAKASIMLEHRLRDYEQATAMNDWKFDIIIARKAEILEPEPGAKKKKKHTYYEVQVHNRLARLPVIEERYKRIDEIVEAWETKLENKQSENPGIVGEVMTKLMETLSPPKIDIHVEHGRKCEDLDIIYKDSKPISSRWKRMRDFIELHELLSFSVSHHKFSHYRLLSDLPTQSKAPKFGSKYSDKFIDKRRKRLQWYMCVLANDAHSLEMRSLLLQFLLHGQGMSAKQYHAYSTQYRKEA